MEQQNTELFLQFGATGSTVWKELELNSSVPFPMTYNIADIRDITKRNTTYSKTLEIPGTKANNELLNYLFDIANVSTYNVNKKVRCTIVVDTVPVISDAYFQITGIKTMDNTHFVYECLVIGDTDSIVKELGNKFLTEVNVSEMNHYYNETSIVNSWTQSWSKGYYYPLVDYGYNWNQQTICNYATGSGGTGSRIIDMRPAVSVKYLWTKMFDNAGWTYESTFIDSATSPWNDLLILGGSTLEQSLTYSWFNSFKAGATGSKVFILSHTYSKASSSNKNNSLQWGLKDVIYSYPPPLGSTNVYKTTAMRDAVDGKSATASTISAAYYGGFGDRAWYNCFTSSRTKFENDSTGGNGDPSGAWSTTAMQYTVGTDPGMIGIGISLDISIPPLSQLFGTKTAPNINHSLLDYRIFTNLWDGAPKHIYFDALLFRSSLFKIEVDALGSPIGYKYLPVNAIPPDGGETAWPVGFINGTRKAGYVDASVSDTTGGTIGGASFPPVTTTYWELAPGSRTVKQFQTPLFNQPGLASSTNPYATLVPGEKLWVKISVRPSASGGYICGPSFSFTLNQEDTYIYSHMDTNLMYNQIAGGQSMLPKNFKQIDFFTGLIKMFNLYIEPSKFISKRLIIEPRDVYYNGGTERNWTNKVDLSKEVSQQIIADTQAKQITMTYKLDKDAFNELYNNQYKEIYGQHIYIVDNDFVKAEQKIELPFASTAVSYLQGANSNSSSSIILPIIAKNSSGVLGKMEFTPRILFKKSGGVVNISDPVNYWKFNGVTYSYYPYVGHFNDPRNATDDLNFGQTNVLYYNLNYITTDNLFSNYYEKQLDELTDRDSRIISCYMKLTAQDMNDLSFRDRIILDGISSGTMNYFRVNKIEYDPTIKGTYKVELLKAKDIPRRLSPRSYYMRPYINASAGLLIGSGNTSYDTNNIFVGNDNFIDTTVTGAMVVGSKNAIYNSSQVLILGSNNVVVKNTAFSAGSDAPAV